MCGLISSKSNFPDERFASLLVRFKSLLGRFNSLFARLGNLPSDLKQNNHFKGPIGSANGPNSGFSQYIPAEHGNSRLSSRDPGSSAAPG
jgi:hypothetical protein